MRDGVAADALDWHSGCSAGAIVAVASVRVCKSAVAECGRGASARNHLAWLQRQKSGGVVMMMCVGNMRCRRDSGAPAEKRWRSRWGVGWR